MSILPQSIRGILTQTKGAGKDVRTSDGTNISTKDVSAVSMPDVFVQSSQKSKSRKSQSPKGKRARVDKRAKLKLKPLAVKRMHSSAKQRAMDLKLYQLPGIVDLGNKLVTKAGTQVLLQKLQHSYAK
jgi:hypothetical protein